MRRAGPDLQNDPIYPDMELYEEILFLKHYHREGDYVVENVVPYYDPLIDGQKRGRHLFWASFFIPSIEIPALDIHKTTIEGLEEKYGFDTSGYGIKHKKRLKMLRNCVHPDLGRHVFDAATTERQLTIDQV